MACGDSDSRRCDRLGRRSLSGAKIDVYGGGVEALVKPFHDGGRSSSLRVCRIGPGRLHVDVEGNLYVPDSEDDSDMEVEPEGIGTAAVGAADEAATKDLLAGGPPLVAGFAAAREDLVNVGPPVVAADGSAGHELLAKRPPMGTMDEAAGMDLVADGPLVVPADRAAGEEMNPEVAAQLAKKVLGEDLHPEVAQRLAEVLAKMEPQPLHHEWFISMCKDMSCSAHFQ